MTGKTLQYLKLTTPIPFQLLYNLGIENITVKQWVYFEPSLLSANVYKHWGKTEVIFSEFDKSPDFKKQRLQIELFVFDLLESFVNLGNVKDNVEMYEIFFDLQKQTLTLKEYTNE